MKTMKKAISLLALAVAMLGCTRVEYDIPSEAGIQYAEAFSPSVTVDQGTNQVTFSVDGTSVVPVWVFQDKSGDWSEYHPQNGYKKIFTSAGDYTVRMHVMNANGVSPDYVEKSFHIDNSIVNFDRYIRYISGGSEKVWRIDNAVPAHQACGESVGNPTGWWAASPDEKKDFGIYDNRLTFTSDGTYTFDPGESGTVYVHNSITSAPYGAYKQDADYTVPVSAQTATYAFSVEGDDLFLTLPAGTLFPYLPNEDYLKDSKFYLISLDNNAMTLVWYTATGNGGGPIAWQFILTSKEGEVTFSGFNYNADSNLWKPADADGGVTMSYYYAPGWAQIADPVVEHSGNKYMWNLPSGTSDRWQAQMFLVPATPISLTSEKHYDFSCILSASKDVTMKVKVHRFDENGSDADNGVVLVDADVPLKGGQDQVFYVSDAAGIDAGNIRLVLDWGGNADNTDVGVARIVLKDHAIDDGTVLPADNPGGDDEPETGAHYDIEGPTNLWRSATVTPVFWYSPSDWSGGLSPSEYQLLEHNGLSVTVPAEVGGAEWMAQNQLQTNIPASADKLYDFCMTIDSDIDIPALTVKLAWLGNDNDHSFFYVNNVSVTAGKPTVFKMPSIAPDTDYDAITLFVDLGRSPGASVTLKDICFQEHQEPQGGGSGDGGLVEGENLWAPAEVTMAYWYSASDWSGNLQPAEAEILPGNGLRVVMPDGIGGSEWMGQNSFHAASLPASKDEVYDFWMTLEADDDMTVTVKLAWEGHDNTNAFFYDNKVELKAGEAKKYVQASIVTDAGADERNDYDGIVLFVDTGRSPAGSEIKMTDIHFQKHIGGSPDEPDQPGVDYTTNNPSIDPSIYDIAGEKNLWRKANVTFDYWYSAGDWSGALAPVTFPADDWGGLKIIVPEGIGGNEWQGQSKWHTDIAVSKDGLYDFCFTVKSDEDINGMTVKLAWEGNDNDHAFFYVNDAVVKAGIPYQFRMAGIAPDVDYDKVVLFIDLGRAKAGTAVSFTDFCLQGNAAASSYGENLWGTPTMETWFSPSDWSGGLDPNASYADGKLTLTVPDGTGGAEWQGQVKLTVPVAVAAQKKYDFSCKILADNDCTVTVKLADANDDSNHAFFYDNAVALTGSNALAYKKSPVSPDQDYTATMLIFDFGRAPVGTAVTVSDFVLREIL